MDWAKAKTILIVAFLVINIFLAYMIFEGGTGYIDYVDGEKVKLITDYLAQKNIKVTGQVPKRMMDMTSITVKYKLFEKEDIRKSFFSTEENIEELVNDGTVKLRGNNLEIGIKDNRELLYTDSSIKPMTEANEKVCKGKIEEFLKRLGMRNDANIRMVEDIEGYKKFTYRQSFRGMAVYNSIMEFYVNDYGVHKAKIIWFETMKQAGKMLNVISPEIALLALPKLYEDSMESELKVLEIQQGYYFGTGANGQVDVSEVVEGTAFPVWKITTDRDIIYINGYNEKVESMEKRQ